MNFPSEKTVIKYALITVLMVVGTFFIDFYHIWMSTYSSATEAPGGIFGLTNLVRMLIVVPFIIVGRLI